MHLTDPRLQLQAKLDTLQAKRVSLQCKIAVAASSPAMTADELKAMFTQFAHIENEIAQLKPGSFDPHA